MCFSAGASFAAASLLLPAGAYCVRGAAKRNRDLLPLAVTPAIFGIQQACEGFVWLGLDRDDPELVRSAALGFLFFALVFWPVWAPLSTLFFRPRRRRWRAILLVACAAAALAAGSVAWVPLVIHSPAWLRVTVASHSIRYEFESLLGSWWMPRAFWQGAYVAVVSIPFLVLPDRSLRAFGLLVAASALAAQLVFGYAFVSVWCAIAAVLSAWLCWLFRTLPVRRDVRSD